MYMYTLEERYPGAMFDALYGFEPLPHELEALEREEKRMKESDKDKDQELRDRYPSGIHSGSLHLYDDEDHTFHASVGDPYGESKDAKGVGFKMDRNGFSIHLKL